MRIKQHISPESETFGQHEAVKDFLEMFHDGLALIHHTRGTTLALKTGAITG